MITPFLPLDYDLLVFVIDAKGDRDVLEVIDKVDVDAAIRRQKIKLV